MDKKTLRKFDIRIQSLSNNKHNFSFDFNQELFDNYSKELDFFDSKGNCEIELIKTEMMLDFTFIIDGEVYLTNHGARGGDWFGKVNFGENYGWKILGWGGTNYSGTKIGPKWKPGYTKAIKYWVPSIAVSSMVIYKGSEFTEWNGDALITALRDQSLRKIKFKDNEFLDEKIIFKNNIGRIRDIEIQENTGIIFLLTDEGSIWRLQK